MDGARHDGTQWRLAGQGYGFWLGAILLGALALRLGLRTVAGTGDYWLDGYSFFADLADGLAAGHGYGYPETGPSATRVPGYPLFIAAATWGSRQAWLLIGAQALVSCGTVACAAALARRMGGPLAGLLAALACAVWPYYAWHDTALQETGLFTFLAALASLLALRLRERRGWLLAAGLGLVLGAAILTRATLLPFALCAAGWLMLRDAAGTPLPKRIASAAIVLAGIGLVLTPWLVRAHELTGAANLGTEFGAAVFAGNHDETFSVFPQGSIDLSRRRAFESLSPEDNAQLAAMETDEVAQNDWYLARGIEWIRANPGRFVAGAARKVWIAFGPLPVPRHGALASLAYAVTWAPLLLLGLAGMWRRRALWRDDLPFHAQFACFAAITALLWAQTSHRAYLDLYLMAYAATLVAPWIAHRIGGDSRLP